MKNAKSVKIITNQLKDKLSKNIKTITNQARNELRTPIM